MSLRSSIVLVAVLALAGPACDKKAPDGGAAAGPGPTATTTDPVADAKRLIAGGALVIDVREQDEWDEGHLAQATLIPVGSVGQRLAEIEQAAGGKDRPIVVYCRSGGRAGAAKDTLAAAGFTKVTNGGGYRKLAAP